jgi:ATP-dependent DNA helicase RecG
MQADKTIDLIYSKYLKALISYNDIYRVEEYLFPRDAFREILLNAINHKDYSTGIPIQISVYEDKIYIWNSGMFPKTIDITKLYEKHPSKPYNPKIALAFFKSGLIESWGRGFEKIKSECKKTNTPRPEISIEDDGVMVKCLPSKKYQEEYKDTIFNPKYKIVKYLEEYHTITTNEATEILKLSAPRMRVILNEMAKEGILLSVGTNKDRHYKLK